MNNAIEQFIATSKASLQALEGMASHAQEGIEKLVNLNMAATKATLGESFSHARSVMEAKDGQEIMALYSGMAQPLVEKSTAYVQHIQTITTDAGTGLSKSVEAHTAEAKKAFDALVETFVKNVPAGTESTMAAFKNALTLGQTAVESAQSSAKKAVEGAQEGMPNDISAAVGEAGKKASKAA